VKIYAYIYTYICINFRDISVGIEMGYGLDGHKNPSRDKIGQE
jgi:hypothetical protein